MRTISTKQEKQVAKTLQGVRTSNSGATPFTKGDVILDTFLIECKTRATPSKSITIQESWFQVLEEERRSMCKEHAAIAISFNCGKDNYYIIDHKTMQIVVELLQ